MGQCEILAGSGAEKSVWPRGWLPEVLVETKGGRAMVGHCGRKLVQFRREGCPLVFSVGFEVTDVNTPLAGGRRTIVKQGNGVSAD